MARLGEGHYAILLSNQQKAKLNMAYARMFDVYINDIANMRSTRKFARAWLSTLFIRVRFHLLGA